AIVARGLHTVLAGLADPAKSFGCPRRVVKNYYPGRPARVILFVRIGLVWTPSAPVRLLQRQVAFARLRRAARGVGAGLATRFFTTVCASAAGRGWGWAGTGVGCGKRLRPKRSTRSNTSRCNDVHRCQKSELGAGFGGRARVVRSGRGDAVGAERRERSS